MMASHRPGETPVPPPPEPAPPTPATGLTRLPESNFLVGFDWVLSFGVLALGFLIASFAVQNPDFWLYLATGRLVAGGGYQFGVDPFSYTGGDRTWVNHPWLFDWVMYEVYRLGHGPAVVIAKAVAVAVTAGLLLLARKPGQPVFAGVVCVGLALVAAAPRLLPQPAAASFLFLAAFLCLLIRLPRRPGAWLFPALVAGLFCLWANCDRWFLLGPLALLLYTVGQYVRADEGEDVGSLWTALVVGVLATLVNPHHVRVWVPPPELFDGRLAEWFGRDPLFSDLFRGAFTPGAIDFGGERSNPANLYSLLGLVALNLIGFTVNYRRASVGLALVFVGAIVLALVHLRAIPFLAFVAAPVAAVNLGAAGRRLAERPLPDGTVRVLHALRGGGRAAVGLIGLLAIALSYPGWLHPFGLQRRWAWDVDPNPSLVRAAERIRDWRAAGALPPEARLLNIQPEFASYLAWYAPGEKSFYDYRIDFHRGEEAAEYAALRRYLAYSDPRKRSQDPFDLRDFLSRWGITYAVYAPPLPDATLAYLWEAGGTEPGKGDWVLWDVQGRAVTFGYARQKAIPTAAFERLRFDAPRTAFADTEPLALPPSPLTSPMGAADVWERFLVPPPTSPVDAEESWILLNYRETLFSRALLRHQRTLGSIQALAHTRLMTPALSRWTDVQASVVRMSPPADATAVDLLASRAARRAILASPDHPDGYYYLALTYSDLGYHSAGDLKEVVRIVSLARARARVPDEPGQLRLSFDVMALCMDLFQAHLHENPQRLDLARDVLHLAEKYAKYRLQDEEARAAAVPTEERSAADTLVTRRRAEIAKLEKDSQSLEADIQRNSERYLIGVQRLTAPTDRAAVARRLGLIREAIAELRQAHEQFQKQLADRPDQAPPPAELAAQLVAHAELIELLWYDGQVEEAARILDTMDTPDALRAMDTVAVRDAHRQVRQKAMALLFPDPRLRPASRYDGNPAAHFRALRASVSMIVGDFERAAQVLAEEADLLHRTLEESRSKNFPNGLPAEADLPDLREAEVGLYTRPFQAAIHLARRNQVEKFAQYRALAMAEANDQLTIGLIYLEWGEVGRAIGHLRAASRDVPGFTSPALPQRQAREFLAAITRARGEGR